MSFNRILKEWWWRVVPVRPGSTTPLCVSGVTILLTNQRTAVFLGSTFKSQVSVLGTSTWG